jgi:hypothetical protein
VTELLRPAGESKKRAGAMPEPYARPRRLTLVASAPDSKWSIQAPREPSGVSDELGVGEARLGQVLLWHLVPPWLWEEPMPPKRIPDMSGIGHRKPLHGFALASRPGRVLQRSVGARK